MSSIELVCGNVREEEEKKVNDSDDGLIVLVEKVISDMGKKHFEEIKHKRDNGEISLDNVNGFTEIRLSDNSVCHIYVRSGKACVFHLNSDDYWEHIGSFEV